MDSDIDGLHTIYDSDWEDLPYFISTSKTAFDMPFLKKFDSEILLATNRKPPYTTTIMIMKQSVRRAQVR